MTLKTTANLLGIVLPALCFLAACSSPPASDHTVSEHEIVEPAPAKTPAPAIEKGEIPAELKVQVLAQLAAADVLDGHADHVLGKCASCNLRMAGSADHGLEVEGYALHFCSDHCQKRFADEPAQRILAMSLPEPTPQP